MSNNNPSKIPNSLRNASSNFPYVAESVDIYDKNSGKNQEQINADTYRKGEVYSKDETNNIISRTPETDVVVLDVPEGSTAADVLDEVPVADRPNKLFRLRNDDNTHYDEYGWTGEAWSLLASKDYGIDDEPDPESDNMVKSSGVAVICGHKIDNPEFAEIKLTLTKQIVEYITKSGKKGFNLDVIFNKNVELSKDTLFIGDVNIDGLMSCDAYSVKLLDNSEFKVVLTDINKKIICGLHNDGNFYFGCGVPKQIVDYVESKLSESSSGSAKKYIRAKSVIKGIDTVWQNQKSYTVGIVDEVYDQCKKGGFGMVRDYVQDDFNITYDQDHNIEDISLILTPQIYEAYKRGLQILAGTVLPYAPFDYMEQLTEDLVTIYDGQHDIVYQHDGITETVRMKVDYWNFFNEPDLNNTADVTIDGETISGAEWVFRRLKVIYNALKSVRPECKVVLGGFHSFDNAFFDELASITDNDGKRFWDYTDIVAYHGYSSLESVHNAQFAHYKSICDRYYADDVYSHLSDKPVWVTECGTYPFTEANNENNKKNILPKTMLTLMSYGVERMFAYKIADYNVFSNVNAGENRFGLLSPKFNGAYAGFTFGDGSPATVDNLLDKLYIFDSSDALPPCFNISGVGLSNLSQKGLRINGKGFTLNRIYVATSDPDGLIVMGGKKYREVKELWSGNQRMDDVEFISVEGSKFSVEVGSSDYVFTDIVINDYNTSFVGFIKRETYDSVKFLLSLLEYDAEPPSVVIYSKYTVARWKCVDGLYNYCVWSNSGVLQVELEAMSTADIFDVSGNMIEKPTTLTTSPVYICGSSILNINLN